MFSEVSALLYNKCCTTTWAERLDRLTATPPLGLALKTQWRLSITCDDKAKTHSVCDMNRKRTYEGRCRCWARGGGSG